MKNAAIFPGTFDPPTLGHINLISRAARLFDRLIVLVASNYKKECLFLPQERVDMLEEILEAHNNVQVVYYPGLVVHYARDNNIAVIVRGIRGASDFGYEFELAMTNKYLYQPIEVVFLPGDPRYAIVRSSAIKQLANLGADVSSMVPSVVAKMLHHRIDFQLEAYET